MSIKTIYIVQTQVLPLGPIPFKIENGLRNSFSYLFDNKRCLEENTNAIYDSIYIKEGKYSITAAPFISNLGQVCLNTRVGNLANENNSQNLGTLVARREIFWDKFGAKESYEDLKIKLDIKPFFGYDSKLKDQRMNNVYFEIRPAIRLRADGPGGCKAKGKLFVHIYPSGFIAIHFAISLRNIDGKSTKELKQLIAETRPWKKNSLWKWSSKLGKMSLDDTYKRVIEEISMSLFNDGSQLIGKKEDWKTAISFETESHFKKIIPEFISDENYKVMKIRDIEGRCGEQDKEYLISSHQGIFYFHSTCREKRRNIRFFWKIVNIYEFILLKLKIYDSYLTYLRPEIDRLKVARLDKIQGIKPKEIIRFNVYISEIRKYCRVLDNHINNFYPFYRAIYSCISEGISFGIKRKKMTEILKEWEEEVSQRKSIIYKLKKIIDIFSQFSGS